MRQEHVYSNYQHWRWLGLIVAAFVIVGTACCCVTWKTIFPAETRAPETFPDAEIVFIAPGRNVGFVNVDGSNLTYLDLVVKGYGNPNITWPWRPVITGDNRTLIVKMVEYTQFVSSASLLAIWQTDALPILCKNWLYQQAPLLTADQSHIFIQVEQGIALYALDSCGTEEEPVEVFAGIFGTPSPDFEHVAYASKTDNLYHNRVIFIQNIGNGNKHIIGEGNFPTWSRDSEWLAYTGPDGIYVYSISDMQSQRVVIYPHPGNRAFPLYLGGTAPIPPEVSWSPDGKWLVYHKWAGTKLTTVVDPSDYAIYKLNIETGEEIKIIDGGMYPYWRWPAEQPGE